MLPIEFLHIFFPKADTNCSDMISIGTICHLRENILYTRTEYNVDV